MITVLLGLVSGFACVAWRQYIKRAKSSTDDYGFDYFMAGMIGGVAAWAIAVVAGAIMPTTWEPVAKTGLASLRSADGIFGEFFLGTGTVQSKAYYFFYTQDEDGDIRPERMLVDKKKIVIREVDDRKPQLVVERKKPANDLLDVFVFTGTRKVFVIPKGSLKRDFRIE